MATTDVVRRVGGIISETNFKFFIQFTGWAALYWCFVLIVFSIFFAESQNEVRFLVFPTLPERNPFPSHGSFVG